MHRRDFIRNWSKAGLLITALPFAEDEQQRDARSPYADFFALPIYRCYAGGIPLEEMPAGFAERLSAPMPVILVREPDNRYDRKSIAIYADGQKLGYLPREDNLILEKLIRRGLPVACRIIGVQPNEDTWHWLSVEVALLYPQHESTNEQLERADDERWDGLEKVSRKPESTRRVTRDPLSAAHVHEDYYWPDDYEEGLSGWLGA